MDTKKEHGHIAAANDATQIFVGYLGSNFRPYQTRGNAIYLIIILGLGGSFHTGYHITGLSSPSPFIQRFINSSWYARYGELPPAQTATMIWSFIVSVFAVGGLCGALSARLISCKLGRKKAMICNSCIAVVAAIFILTSKGIKSFEMIIVARVLHGFCSGLGTCTQLMYLSEISPRKIRGIVTLTLTTFSSLGKLSGRFFGLSEILGREELWNVLLCIPACFSVIQILLLPFLPEAPRYLFIEKGDDKACKKALQSLWGPGDYKQEMDEMLIEQAAIEAATQKSPLQLLRTRSVRWQLFTLSLICGCNQMSGMSVVSTFSYDIFLKGGLPKDKIRYVTLGLGAAEICTSICCGLLMECIGRRPLFWFGYCVMSVSWVLVTITVNLQDSADWVPYLTAVFIVIVIIFFCGGPGGALPTLNSEIFIQSHRMAAVVLISSQRWLVYALAGLVFPFLIEELSSYCYLIFACWCLLGCLYTFLILPETRGKSQLEISEQFKAITVCGKSFTEEETKETKL